MAKRKQTKPNTDAYPEYDQMPLDTLYGERRSTGIQMHALGAQYHELRLRHDYLSNRIRLLASGESGIGISDHAVIRYLERIKGVDIKAVRDEIRAMASLRKIDAVPDQIVSEDGASFAIYDGTRIATVWKTPEAAE